MALGKRKATRNRKRSSGPKKVGMNHSAYCMMVRSVYDLLPSKRKRKVCGW